MAPLELTCRGGDPRALKGFIAAALGGVDAKFAPMTKATEATPEARCRSHVPPTPAALAPSPATSAATRSSPPPAPSDGPPSDGPSGSRRPRPRGRRRVRVQGRRRSRRPPRRDPRRAPRPDGASVAGAPTPTLADVAIYAALYPIFGEGGAGRRPERATWHPDCEWHARSPRRPRSRMAPRRRKRRRTTPSPRAPRTVPRSSSIDSPNSLPKIPPGRSFASRPPSTTRTEPAHGSRVRGPVSTDVIAAVSSRVRSRGAVPDRVGRARPEDRGSGGDCGVRADRTVR